ncbi:MAG: hypothetical protein ACD_20C00085G0034 [uncultured bacterium]|nr:MAG: hypothetical protein ACD_20C00085G0034 [uncultured bacterium]HBH17673.1 hypothetical protein [Cyanobacteria bacterium UBA9579]
MKRQTKRIVHLSGNYTVDTTEVISDITSLCRMHKISIDDINMTTFDKNKYYAMISSCYFPDNDHLFWNELFQVTSERNVNVNLSDKED